MCIWHCYIKEDDVKHLNNLGEDIEYKEKWSILDVLCKLSNICAIEYILNTYIDKFNYYNVNLFSIIHNLNLSHGNKNYLTSEFKDKIDFDVDDITLDYNDSNFDIASLELYVHSKNIDISTEFMFDVISKIKVIHIEDAVDWFILNSDINNFFIIDAVINRGDVDTIKSIWVKLKDSL